MFFWNKKNSKKENSINGPKLGKDTKPIETISKEELASKLNELIERKKEVIESPGAMCYETVMLKPEPYVCKDCGETNLENGYWNYTVNEVSRIVTKINSLGYDAVLDTKEFCTKCSNGINIEKPQLIFKIKYRGENEYHEVRTNVTSDYRIFLAFLENKDTYNAGHGQTISIKKEIKVIEKMTGIKYEE